MTIVELWHIRPDAPYKSRLWGMWVVDPEDVHAIVAKVRSVEEWESVEVFHGQRAEYTSATVDGSDVLFVREFTPGLLYNGDNYGDFPEMYA